MREGLLEEIEGEEGARAYIVDERGAALKAGKEEEEEFLAILPATDSFGAQHKRAEHSFDSGHSILDE